MPPDPIEAGYFSPDILDFIVLLHRYQVRYLVVGGEAVIHYGHARLTGDIDFFYDRASENAVSLFQVLREFWSGNIPGLREANELQEPGIIIQFGLPPNRIDLLNQIDGVEFCDAWPTRVSVALQGPSGEIPLYYLGLGELIRNKEAAGRPKDQDDLNFLRKLPGPE